ncbi:MAG: hypothetical protein IJG40_05930 [Oscillospiraceae bacterium]|nr:hypothetical protein [Oscillospiraceae bacterium]
MKRRKDNKLIVVLEWICGIALVFALITTTWAMFEYKDRNGSFLPKMDKPSESPAVSDGVLPAAITPPPDASKLEMDPGATSETPAPQQIEEEENGVCVAGFKTMRIAANKTEIAVDFENPPENEGEYLMTFELLFPISDGSYETLYSSGLVEAGQHIRNINLLHPIAAGTYENCILRIQPYYVSDRSPASTAQVNFTLYAG